MILNLGSGKKLYPDALNVDITEGRGDIVQDLGVFPWQWADNSIDGIHASHILEHFHDTKGFLLECHRILKPGGFLRLVLPHASNVSAVGHLGHYRTFAYSSMTSYLEAHKSAEYYFGRPLFKTVEERINWWYEARDAEGHLNKVLAKVLELIDNILTPIINLTPNSPKVFENLWWTWVGGAKELVYKGLKI
jgi:SAM-dependent methyltransferase